MRALAGEERAELDTRFQRPEQAVIESIHPERLPPLDTEEQILECAVKITRARSEATMERLLTGQRACR